MGVISAAADARNGTDWSDVTFVHCTRWQDEPIAQLSHGSNAYPKGNRSRAWQLWHDRGAHVSIANLIEMQMRHGMPPLQEALNHGILPSLSPDVEGVVLILSITQRGPPYEAAGVSIQWRDPIDH